MMTLGDFLGPPKSGTKTEWIPRDGLPSHMGNDTGWPHVSDTIQCSRGQCHQEIVGHNIGGPEGESLWSGSGSWGVLGFFYADDSIL